MSDPTGGIVIVRHPSAIALLLAYQEPFEEDDDVVAICLIHEGSVPSGKRVFVHVIVENPSSGKLAQEVWISTKSEGSDFTALAAAHKPVRGFGFQLVPMEVAVNALRHDQPTDIQALKQLISQGRPATAWAL